MREASADGSTRDVPRLSQPPRVLVRRALGSPTAMPGKLLRLLALFGRATSGTTLDARLTRLVQAGVVERAPSRLQLLIGAIDMLTLWIEPAARDYYAQRGIDFRFHQLLRFLDEPASVADPLGLASDRDGIIEHLVQVVHANPLYDLQLLQAHDGGLDALERELEALVAGRHPRARSIGAIVEEPDYHARLLAFVRDHRRRGAEATPMLRRNVAEAPRWRDLEATFGSLTRAMRYFASLPDRPVGALRHLRARDAAGPGRLRVDSA